MKTSIGQRRLDDLERRLLDAARIERPNARSRERTMIAIASGAALGSLTASSAAATVATSGAAGTGTIGGAKLAGAVSFMGVAKAVAVGAISGAVALGAAQKIQEPRHAPPPAAQVEAPVETRSDPTRPKLATDPPHVDETAEPMPEAPAFEPNRPAKASPPVAVVHVEGAPIPSPERVSPSSDRLASSLADEVARLDRVRDALLSADPNRALAMLDDYQRAVPTSTLSAEATLLRIEALVQKGERDRAAGLAAEFLRAHPESPVADRMRAIVHAASK